MTELKLLIVEDEVLTLAALEKMVERSGTSFTVHGTAANGKEAVVLVNKIKPSLVVTDIRMPEMDGLELIGFLYKSFPWIKIIILSGYSDFTYARQGIKYDVLDYLLKPVKQEALKGVLHRAEQVITGKYRFSLECSWEPETIDCFEKVVFYTGVFDCQRVQVYLKQLWRHFVGEESLLARNDLLQACRMLVRAVVRRTGGPEGFEFLITGEDFYQEVEKALFALIEELKNRRDHDTRRVLMDVKKYIDEHYEENITLRDLSEIAYLNQCYLSELFKEKFGESFLSYLTKIRIAQARKLLVNPRLTVYQVARQVGYQDQAYFSRLFKKKTGMNPIDYRRKLGVI